MKFNLKRTLACSLAFGWISLFWGSYDSIMQLFDYDVFGLSSTWHGVIIAADNILGLFLLPLFGRLSDKSHSCSEDCRTNRIRALENESLLSS